MCFFRSRLCVAAQYNAIDSLLILLQHNADVNVPDLSRQTPLHFAAAAGHTSLIEILLSDIVGNTIDVDVRRNVIHSNDDDENGLYVFLASRR